MAVSHVTCAELLWGARNKKELQAIRKDLDNLVVIPIDANISMLSIELVSAFSLSHKLSLPDSLIGATAIVHDIELFTLNTKDFRFIKKIKLFSEKV